MRSLLCKIGLVLLAVPACLLAGPAGPPAGNAILNSPAYQRHSQMWVDTVTVQGILQLPYGSATPPANQCTVSSQTGRMFIVSSTTAGGARIWVCEGINGWQIKSSSSGAGGSGTPGGTNGQFEYNNSGAFAGSANLTTDGSTITATRFAASTVTISNLTTFLGVSSTTWNSVSTVTFNDGVLVDMSGINDSNIGEGLLIPKASDGCSNATRDSSLCWDTANKLLYVGNGSGVTSAMNYSLRTLNGPVVVSSPTTTLNFSSTTFVVTAPVTSTASVTLNPSSVTMLGSGNINFQGTTRNSFQPSFLAYDTAEYLNVTGDGILVTVPFDTVGNDNTSAFSASTFTAQVTGRYLFTWNVYIRDTAAGNKCETRLVTTGHTFTTEKFPTSHTDDNHGGALVMPMTAGNTAYVQLYCSGGLRVVDILATSLNTGVGNTTYFSGTLLN